MNHSTLSADALLRGGIAALGAGDPVAAERAFRAAAVSTPTDIAVWNNLAVALVAQGQQGQALEALQHSLGIDANQPATWTALATSCLAMERFETAEAACAAALQLDPDSVDAWQARTLICSRREDFAAASEAYDQVFRLAGESAELCLQHGVALLKAGRFAEAAARLARSCALDSQSAVAREIRQVCDLIVSALSARDDDGMLGKAAADVAATPDAGAMFKAAFLYLANFDHDEAAARVADAWVRHFPQDIEAAHLSDAASSRAVERQPAQLVAQHFDAMAEDFDERLVQRLGYRGPQRLQSLIAANMPAERRLDVLDLGCGTGLCGPMLRPYARRLAGIDLSPRMIEKARDRDLYDNLEEGDLVTALEGRREDWDLLVAGDTLPYLGALETVFEDAARALRSGGWFAFSVEDVEGDDYVLKPNGRYGHSQAYIGKVSAGHFLSRGRLTSVLRREGGRDVPGAYYLLQRPAADA